MRQGQAPFKKNLSQYQCSHSKIIFPDEVQLKKIKYEHPLNTRLNTKLTFSFTSQWFNGIHCKVKIPFMLETDPFSVFHPSIKILELGSHTFLYKGSFVPAVLIKVLDLAFSLSSNTVHWRDIIFEDKIHTNSECNFVKAFRSNPIIFKHGNSANFGLQLFLLAAILNHKQKSLALQCEFWK